MTQTDTDTITPTAPKVPARPADPRDALARMRTDRKPVEVASPAVASEREEPQSAQAPVVEAPAAPGTATLDRTQILDATEVVLNEYGYDGATIRRIAKQLGCAVGSIYRYFRDKRELLSAVTQRRFEPIVEQVEAGHPWHATASAYVQTAIAQPQQYRLMFWLAGCDQRGLAEAPDVVQRVLAGWAEQLSDRKEAEQRWAQLHGRIMLGQADTAASP